jgi:hypothetical protein
VPKRHHRYGERTGGNLTYAGWDGLLAGFARIMAGCVAMLRPAGTAVITSRPVRRNPDDLIDLPGLLLDAAGLASQRPAGVTHHRDCLGRAAGCRPRHLPGRRVVTTFTARGTPTPRTCPISAPL